MESIRQGQLHAWPLFRAGLVSQRAIFVGRLRVALAANQSFGPRFELSCGWRWGGRQFPQLHIGRIRFGSRGHGVVNVREDLCGFCVVARRPRRRGPAQIPTSERMRRANFLQATRRLLLPDLQAAAHRRSSHRASRTSRESGCVLPKSARVAKRLGRASGLQIGNSEIVVDVIAQISQHESWRGSAGSMALA